MKIFFRLLKVLGLSAFSISPAIAEKVEGSWITFQRQTADFPIFVRMLRGQEDYLSQTKAAIYVLDIPFQAVDEFGFPTDQEYEKLFQLDETIHNMELAHNFQVIGITTAQTQRQLFVLVAGTESDLEPLTDAVKKAAYVPQVVREADGLAVYLENLRPTDLELSIAADISVLDELRKNGDRKDVVRPVDHYAIFSTKDDAERFVGWLKTGDFMSIEIRHVDVEDSFQVFFQHLGTMIADELIAITVALRTTAIDFGGRYDGWETAVMR